MKNFVILIRTISMLLLLTALITGCKKKSDPERTNFFEFTIEGKKLSFNVKDTVLLDTVPGNSFWQLDIDDNLSPQHSNFRWTLLSRSKWVNGTYEYPGTFAERSVFDLQLSTYVNGPWQYYYLTNGNLNVFKITIDRSDNGRLHGIFSGNITCPGCSATGTIVPMSNGEFEMPYRFK